MRDFDNFLLYENEFVIYLHGQFVFTNQHKNNLIEQFKSLETDILSPLIRNKHKLVYFGGYFSENDYYYLDQRILKMKELVPKSCLFFCQQTQLHYQQLFICRRKFYQHHFDNFEINRKSLSQFRIHVTPFIQIHTLNNHFQQMIINPYTFENKCWSCSLQKHHQLLQSYKIEDYKTSNWNQLPNVLLLIEDQQLNLIKKNITYFQKLKANLFVFGNEPYPTPTPNPNDNKLPDDFNVKLYLLLNRDIEVFSKKEYLRHGRSQQREYKIPSDFNWKRYIMMNEDLKNIKNKSQAENHYLKFGHYEFRNYRKNITCRFLLRDLNNIDYLRFHGVNVNSRILNLEEMLKKNNNLFDYILILGKDYYSRYIEVISQICIKSKVSRLDENNYFFNIYSKLTDLPLISSKYQSKDKQICIIYQCYYQISNYQKILDYFRFLNNNYSYHLILVNNNPDTHGISSDIQSLEFITYLESENKYREMGAYQTGVNHLRDNQLLSKFSAYILMNETLFTNFPLYVLDVLDYTHINRVVMKPIVLGKVDKHRRNNNCAFTCNDWVFARWIRSNFILINSEIFNKMVHFNLVHYTPENIFKDDKINIPMSQELETKITKWLSKERYQHYDLKQYQLKMSAILNEYKLSHNLLSLSKLHRL